MFIPPYRITMSGGGMKGLAHIGALEVLQEKGYLKAVKEYVGISAGALVAFMVCVGCTLSEIRLTAQLLDLGTVRDLDPETMIAFPDTFGFDTGANVEKLLAAILRAKRLSPNVTFEELARAKVGPALRVFATDLNTCMPVDLCAEKTPTLEVRLAVRASMTIPIYFTPVRNPIDGHLLVDGGVVTHTPFKLLTVEERSVTLSIAFADDHKPKGEITSLLQMLIQIYHCVEYYGTRQLEAAGWVDRIMYLPCGSVNTLEFEKGAEEKVALMEIGRRAAEEYLRGMGGRQRPARRFSLT